MYYSAKLVFMRWQDIVISICQIGFVIALIPSIRSRQKPILFTSMTTFILVSIITLCLFSLKLWFAGITGAMIAVAWGTLVVQRLAIDKKKSRR